MRSHGIIRQSITPISNARGGFSCLQSETEQKPPPPDLVPCAALPVVLILRRFEGRPNVIADAHHLRYHQTLAQNHTEHHNPERVCGTTSRSADFSASDALISEEITAVSG
eukprot:574356-Rhodomonas_salina.1